MGHPEQRVTKQVRMLSDACKTLYVPRQVGNERLETNIKRWGLMTSSICRAVNVVFSELFIESFKTVNDIKTRRDHETQNTNKTFWINAALAYNDCNDEEGDPMVGDSFSKLLIADVFRSPSSGTYVRS
jgi:hypothetical protein